MPIVEPSYKAPLFFKNGHVSTIYSGLVRRVHGVEQNRERITLPDEDFLDLDWSFANSKTDKLIIVLHGLEGHAQRPYMTGVAKLFNNNGFDAVCVNFRGCSGEDNLKYRSYHSGATEDLEAILNHILATKTYSEITLNGFSLGGNMLLKYLGERDTIPNEIKAAIAVSVPCDLHGSCKELHKFKNVAYHENFKKYLVNRLRKKQKKHTDALSIEAINSIKTLKDFDDVYTSKAHGFSDALDYYAQCSSLQFLPNIHTPTLIINALNDSFLSPECYPVKEAKQNPDLFLEMPKHGGHVGFHLYGKHYYNERRALEFVLEKGIH
ncbi:alpha/beta hydrolase [Hanstruepera neustonica]|uniref:Alpha/beta hydrolase n=1 Tax=Hanstruepera neustonica TaxID=1445657 RepID=A0A2K1DXM2_9FLAO|nr:alpha/beta fold hydrolase [Hanstruepera neustonica]PNQ72757.1 alpha/beta hydrolase [Hanstruepera neustonica]